MIEASEVLFLWTETPLHAGGGSTTGAVDLPIQRDRQTGHPIIQASGVKGVLRDHCQARWGRGTPLTNAVFGPDTDASEYGGAVSVSDARILLFPVRSLRGVCAWITCPLALARLWRDLDRCGLADSFPPLPDALPGEGTAWVTPASPIALPATGTPEEVVLEEYALPVTANAYVKAVAAWLVNTAGAVPGGKAYAFWRKQILDGEVSHLAILADDDFAALVEGATDVAQRIKVNDDTGTVSNTGLWTEENLPADSLLWNVLHGAPPRAPLAALRSSAPGLLESDRPSAARVLACISRELGERPLLQIGGDGTVGRGLTRVCRFGRASEEKEGGNADTEDS